MTNDSKQLKLLTQSIEKLLNKQVLPVAPVASVLPLAPVNTSDHDLLTRLDEKVDSIILQIKDINDGIGVKLNDHENRLRNLERYVWLAIGALAVLEIVMKFYLK